MPEDLRDLSARDVLDAATSTLRTRRLLEVQELRVLEQWVAMHGADPLDGLDARGREHARAIGKVLRQLGGEGTPGVQDFCLGEIALAREEHVNATRSAMADVLDLVHRMPLTWAVCLAGDAEVWVARTVASRSRRVPADRMWIVDQAVARMIATESIKRILDVADAKIIEADTGTHEDEVAEAKQRGFAAVGQTEDDGTRMVVARIDAADGPGIDAVLERVAEALLTSHPDATLDERRSMAMGYFGRLGQLFELLLRGVDPTTDPNTDPDAIARALAIPADVLDLLRDPAIAARIAPQAKLYVHLHEAVLLGEEGVARVEGLGAMTLSELQVLLARHNVVVQPVIDLSDRVRTTAYEHPESIKERVHLITGGDYWPYASSTGRGVDYDHPTPYRPGAPPDHPPQTGTHNSGPLGRRHHRWKTRAGFTSRQCGHGRYVWLTPHGLAFLVDHRGSRRIDPDEARQMLGAGEQVELYFPDQPLSVEINLRR
ncbi:hypothetical protein [Nocardioides marmoribigeumensis]|uniref:DUF222 domain-containing protein n=1 Tax=Nocardioides marmoribigeumensis TaxID=433649 RepID=A0ABU2BZ64_9ACTN|nr:hypothetical protein [Nocardioides marmoribigeumensis]MDR7363677.1 hypothetical protein [Nocardioides marmoribigeumensis]